MSLLKEFEQRFEKLFEGFFVKHFKSTVKPIELAKRIAKEMEQKKTPGISGYYLPNQYKIFLSSNDFENLAPISSALIKEFKEFLLKRAKEENAFFLGPPSVEIKPDNLLNIGEAKIESKIEPLEHWEMPSFSEKTQIFSHTEIPLDKVATGAAFLLPKKQGIPFSIDKDTITIGRTEDNNLTLHSPSVSRYHARIEKKQKDYYLHDLQSTNGTFVNNKRINRHKLRNGDLVAFAEEEFEFRSE